jgi:hypothetical protein
MLVEVRVGVGIYAWVAAHLGETGCSFFMVLSSAINNPV